MLVTYYFYLYSQTWGIFSKTFKWGRKEKWLYWILFHSPMPSPYYHNLILWVKWGLISKEITVNISSITWRLDSYSYEHFFPYFQLLGMFFTDLILLPTSISLQRKSDYFLWPKKKKNALLIMLMSIRAPPYLSNLTWCKKFISSNTTFRYHFKLCYLYYLMATLEMQQLQERHVNCNVVQNTFKVFQQCYKF